MTYYSAHVLTHFKIHQKLNYGRIYGEGQPKAKQKLLQFNPQMSHLEAVTKVQKVYDATNGKKINRLVLAALNHFFDFLLYNVLSTV